jgi:hypothetical protein
MRYVILTKNVKSSNETDQSQWEVWNDKDTKPKRTARRPHCWSVEGAEGDNEAIGAVLAELTHLLQPHGVTVRLEW